MERVKLRKAVMLAANAEGETKLNAFDNALLKAGIGNANLVKLSSVIPRGVKWLSNVPEFPVGTVLPVIYSHLESEETGLIISAALGVGISDESCGLVFEYSGYCKRGEAVDMVKKMVSEGFMVRGWKLRDLRVAVAEHTVKFKPGAVLAAVVFFP